MTDLDQMLAAEVQQRQRDRRERIATEAMAALITNQALARLVGRDFVEFQIAGAAIRFADALIAKLDKEQQP